MEFDKYGRLKNPGISSTDPVNTYTHIQNSRSSRTFAPWDWFNDFVIGIGNFIANSTEFIIGALAWIVIIAGGITGIVFLFDVWSIHSFIAAALITVLGGGILYYVFMFILGILYWIVSISLVIVRYIFYNAYTLLLVIGICLGIVWYNNREPSYDTAEILNVEREQVMSETDVEGPYKEESRLEEPSTEEPKEIDFEKEEIDIGRSTVEEINNNEPINIDSPEDSPAPSKGTGFKLEKVDHIPYEDNPPKSKTGFRLERSNPSQQTNNNSTSNLYNY